MLSLQDFEDLLDRWGDDVASWPQPARLDAQALMAQDPRAVTLLAEVRRMRELLATPPAPRARPELAARILAAAAASPQSPPQPRIAEPDPPRLVGLVVWLPRFWLQPVLVLPLCFALGLLFGIHSVSERTTILSSDELPAFFLALRP